MRDYLAVARAYEASVLAGLTPACRWVRLAVQRNVQDLARVGTDGFAYCPHTDRARAICIAAESFPHIKGPLATVVGHDDGGRAVWQTIRLEPWQVWLLTTIYGWVHVETGLRRYRVALVLVPRKNAKSTLGAVALNYALTADGEGGAEVYSAATTRDQAKVSAEIAWEMARRSHAFREYFGVRIGAKTTRTLEVPSTASRFSPLSADAHSLDGLNISFALIDELHAHKTRAVWDVLETAIGARAQPLILAITTAGSDIHGICFEKLEYLHKILDGIVTDEEFFGVDYTIDPEDAWDDETAWRKANPNYGVSVRPDDLRRKAREAAQSPGGRNNFLTKHLNVWVTSHEPCLSVDGWRQGQVPAPPGFDVEALRHESCWVGIDLASQIDLCALTLVFPPTTDRPRWRWVQRIWTPAETLQDRAHRDRAPYLAWVQQGWLHTTPGTRLDHQVVLDALVAARDRYDVRMVGFDPWHADRLIDELSGRLGFAETQIVKVPQTFAGMSSACLRVQADMLAGDIDAGGCPVTAWAVSNVVANRDGKDNLMFAKGRSRGRIDPVIAGTIGTALWLKQPDEAPSIYETRGLVTV